MELKTRIEKLEKQLSGSDGAGLAVIVQPGETTDDAIRRTTAEAGDTSRRGHMIVVPAKAPARAVVKAR